MSDDQNANDISNNTEKKMIGKAPQIPASDVSLAN
jgi:hypothetical protein